MTDDQLELRLREWYLAEVSADETAPAALRSSLATIARPSEWSPRGLGSRRWVALAAAALLTAALVGGGVLVGSGIVKLTSVPPSTVPSIAPAKPTASASPEAAVVVTPSPQLTTPSSSPKPCVLTGDALPPVDRVGIEGLGQSRGVYVAGRPPMLWAVNPGQDSAPLIASIPTRSEVAVPDISPDGSNALIGPSIFGGASGCAGIYLIRTDGLGATRLTTFGGIPTAAFSRDGRRIAFSRESDPGTVTTLDLETGR